MITLLLTLFICLFSYCPSVNRLEDHKENNIILNNELAPKRTIAEDNYLYIGFMDFATYDNFIAFSRYIKQFDYFPMSNITVANFLLGQTVHIDLNGNYDVSVGDFVDGEFVVNSAGTRTLEYIEFSYDGSLDYKKEFSVSFRYSGGTRTNLGTYSFSENNESTPICNYSLSFGGTLVYYPQACLKFNLTQFSNLLGGYVQTLNNYDLGYKDGVGYGYQQGYGAGYQEGVNIDSTAATIFNGVLEIGLLPVNFFLSIFNFEVFGINIKGIVSGLLTVSVVIIIVRFLFGGKDNDK